MSRSVIRLAARLKLPLVLSLLLWVALLAACGSGSPKPVGTPVPVSNPAAEVDATTVNAATRAAQSRDSTATLWVYVTDAPARKVQGVRIGLNNLEVALDRGSDTDWIPVGSGPRSFELIATTENWLGGGELPPGHYDRLRVDLTEALVNIGFIEKLNAQGQGWETESVEALYQTLDPEDAYTPLQTARVTSNQLEFAGGFDLIAGEINVLTLDFNAEKSVVIQDGASPVFRPSVRLFARKNGQTLAQAALVAEIP